MSKTLFSALAMVAVLIALPLDSFAQLGGGRGGGIGVGGSGGGGISAGGNVGGVRAGAGAGVGAGTGVRVNPGTVNPGVNAGVRTRGSVRVNPGVNAGAGTRAGTDVRVNPGVNAAAGARAGTDARVNPGVNAGVGARAGTGVRVNPGLGVGVGAGGARVVILPGRYGGWYAGRYYPGWYGWRGHGYPGYWQNNNYGGGGSYAQQSYPVQQAYNGPGVAIRNDTDQTLNFAIDNSRQMTIEPNETTRLADYGDYMITFDRGDNFGQARYTVYEGQYAFQPTGRGWELYRQKEGSATAAQSRDDATPRTAERPRRDPVSENYDQPLVP